MKEPKIPHDLQQWYINVSRCECVRCCESTTLILRIARLEAVADEVIALKSQVKRLTLALQIAWRDNGVTASLPDWIEGLCNEADLKELLDARLKEKP
jgi:hypothetical protein